MVKYTIEKKLEEPAAHNWFTGIRIPPKNYDFWKPENYNKKYQKNQKPLYKK